MENSFLYEHKTFTEPKLSHIDIECSSFCNLSCNFCPRPKENGTMPIEDIKRLIKEFADMGGETIKLFWRGEPFLYEHFPIVLAYAKSLGLKNMVNTNGTMPTPYVFESLNNIDWLSFSVDYQHNNIDCALTAVGTKELYPNMYIEIQSSSNSDAVKQICDKANIPYKVDLPTKRSDKDTTSEVITGERKYCSFPEWRLIIDWQGNAHPCCVCWDDDTLIMGNIYTQSLSEIFNGDKMNQLRQDLKDGNYFKYKTCKNCTSRKAYK